MAKKKFYTPVVFQYNLGWLKFTRALTDDDIAKAIGLHRKSIVWHRNGDTAPNVVTFFKYCTLFGVTPDELYSKQLYPDWWTNEF